MGNLHSRAAVPSGSQGTYNLGNLGGDLGQGSTNGYDLYCFNAFQFG